MVSIFCELPGNRMEIGRDRVLVDDGRPRVMVVISIYYVPDEPMMAELMKNTSVYWHYIQYPYEADRMKTANLSRVWSNVVRDLCQFEESCFYNDQSRTTCQTHMYTPMVPDQAIVAGCNALPNATVPQSKTTSCDQAVCEDTCDQLWPWTVPSCSHSSSGIIDVNRSGPMKWHHLQFCPYSRQTNCSSWQTSHTSTKSSQKSGKIAGWVIGLIVALVIATVAVVVFIVLWTMQRKERNTRPRFLGGFLQSDATSASMVRTSISSVESPPGKRRRVKKNQLRRKETVRGRRGNGEENGDGELGGRSDGRKEQMTNLGSE